MMEFCDPKEFQIIVAIDEERYIIKRWKSFFPGLWSRKSERKAVKEQNMEKFRRIFVVVMDSLG